MSGITWSTCVEGLPQLSRDLEIEQGDVAVDRAHPEAAEEVAAVDQRSGEVELQGGLAGLALGDDERAGLGRDEVLDARRWCG